MNDDEEKTGQIETPRNKKSWGTKRPIYQDDQDMGYEAGRFADSVLDADRKKLGGPRKTWKIADGEGSRTVANSGLRSTKVNCTYNDVDITK